MKGKHIVLGLLGTLGALLGLVFWLGATGGGTASESGRATRAAAMRARPDAGPPGASSREATP